MNKTIYRFLPHLLVVATSLTLAVTLVPHGLPCPRVDDAFYKSPAAELVQTGRLAFPSCVGFVPRAETVFACYPPVYQGLLGAWFFLFGVSLHTSLAYSFTVHALGALAVTEICYRLLSSLARRFERWSSFRTVASSAVGLIYAGNLAYFDRQEETALLWIFAEILLYREDRKMGWRRCVASGFLIGLAGLTSPYVGVLGAALVAVRAFHSCWATGAASWLRTFGQLSVQGGTAVVPAVVWYVTMENLYPGIINDQFFWLLAHLKRTQNLGDFPNRVWLTISTVAYYPPQLPAVALLLVGFPLAVRRSGLRQIDSLAVAIYFAGCVGLVLLAVMRPTAYTYLGATFMLLLPCLAVAIENLSTDSDNRAYPKWGMGMVVAVCCLLPAYRHAASMVQRTLHQTEDSQVDAVIARLRKIVPRGDRVAVTARHWHAFQGRNPWREAYFTSVESPDEVLGCRWLVLDAECGKPGFIDRFELVEQLPASADVKMSYAYSLWRRRTSGDS